VASLRCARRDGRRRTPLHKTLSFLALLGGALLGSVFYRRRSARRLERVELYGPDGQMASVPDGTADAERMLALARDVISLPG
jgi:hypothetical protein